MTITANVLSCFNRFKNMQYQFTVFNSKSHPVMAITTNVFIYFHRLKDMQYQRVPLSWAASLVYTTIPSSTLMQRNSDPSVTLMVTVNSQLQNLTDPSVLVSTANIYIVSTKDSDNSNTQLSIY